MKLNKTLLASAVALFASASAAFAADTVIDIVGATAFRAAAHNTIRATLGEGTVYGYNRNAASQGDLESASKAIFIKVVGEDRTIVRTAWSGSVEGIQTLTEGRNNDFIDIATYEGSLATGVGAALTTSPTTQTLTTAHIAFSDVQQTSTLHTTPTLLGGGVGVIPFVFVASKSAPEGLENITDQQFIYLFKSGLAPASLFTGDAADAGKTILATGRNNLSGTRTTAFAETGLGIFTPVQQYGAPNVGGYADINQADIFYADSTTIHDGDSGFGSGGDTTSGEGRPFGGLGLRGLLKLESSDPDYSFIGYLGESDATNAVAGGAKKLKYNGVEFTAENVKNGSYTFWGEEQLYRHPSLAGVALAFFNDLTADIPDNLAGAGIPLSELEVVRSGDGGPIVPKATP